MNPRVSLMAQATTAPTSAATSGAPASAASSGVGTPDPVSPLNALVAMLAEEPQPGVTDPNEAPPAPGLGAPETAPAPGAAGDPGQTTSPPGEPQPPAEGETPPGDGAPPNPPSDTERLTAAITALSPTERAAALELFERERGKLPSLAKVTGQNYGLKDRVTELEKQNRELAQQIADGASTNTREGAYAPQALPESVSKLKTVQAVQARQATLESSLDQISDFLDANPGDPKTVYDLESGEAVNVESDGKRYLSRAQIIARRNDARAELRALPKQAEHLTRTAELSRTHATLHAELATLYPTLANADDAETQMYHAALSLPLIANHPGGPLIALKLAKGHTLVEAERAKAKEKAAGNGHGKPPIVQPFTRSAQPGAATHQGKIPVRQPSPAGGGAPPAPRPDKVAVDEALTRNRKEGSAGSLANLLAATGR